MSRKFRVTIGGISYNVEVEEVGAAGSAIPAAAPAAVAASAPVRQAAPAPAPVAAALAPAPAAAPAATGKAPSAAGEVVKAPLPGMLAAVKVEVGQTVNQGQVVCVLEAMKMENDITAPVAGTIREILVQKGTAVSLGDALVVIG